MKGSVEPADLRALVEHNADGILIVDDTGTVRFANPAAGALFGRPREELAGTPFGLPLLGGEATEVDVVRPGGLTLAVELRTAPVRWDGVPAQVVTLRDVTERRRATERERELIRAEAARGEAEQAALRAEFLSRASAALGASLDVDATLARTAALSVPFLADYAIVHAIRDDGAAEPVAAVHRDPEGQLALDETLRAYHVDPSDEVSPVARVARTGRAEVHAEIPPELASRFAAHPRVGAGYARLAPASFLAVPLLLHGRPLGVLTLVHAASGRRFDAATLTLAEEMARRAALALENARLFRATQLANRAKSQFLATMSHEIRTPINAIVGYADLLDAGIGGTLEPPQQGYVERIKTSSRHLLGLVNDVLDLSKIEAGEMSVRHERVPLLATAGAALEMVAPQAAAKGILLLQEWACPEDDAFAGDADRVRQILVNLLSNALKFTDAGGSVTLRCRVSVKPPVTSAPLRASPRWAVLEVEDTGMGIDPDKLEQVFDPFVQVDGSYTRRQGGTGLGLAISRRLARLMGGDLTVESTPGQGSCFSLWLPSAQRARAAAAQASGAAGEEGAEDGEGASPEPASWPARPGQVPGLGEVGRRLADRAEAVVERLGARLRAELEVPGIGRMSRAQVEDHVSTYLLDVGMMLVALDEEGGEPALVQDGHQIQRLIAWKHADQRVRLGWTRSAMRREQEILREEVDAAVGDAEEEAGGREVLHRLLAEGEAVALARFREGDGEGG